MRACLCHRHKRGQGLRCSRGEPPLCGSRGPDLGSLHRLSLDPRGDGGDAAPGTPAPAASASRSPPGLGLAPTVPPGSHRAPPQHPGSALGGRGWAGGEGPGSGEGATPQSPAPRTAPPRPRPLRRAGETLGSQPGRGGGTGWRGVCGPRAPSPAPQPALPVHSPPPPGSAERPAEPRPPGGHTKARPTQPRQTTEVTPAQGCGEASLTSQPGPA